MYYSSKYIVILKGGIGNQLFQYAYAQYLNKIEGKQVSIYFKSKGDSYKRDNIIKGFNNSVGHLSGRILDRLASMIISRANNLFTKIMRMLVALIGLQFTMKYQEGLINQYIKGMDERGTTILDGYWQSAEMANTVMDELLREVGQVDIKLKEYTEIAALMYKHKHSVAVHIRDFSDSINHNQQTLSEKYYEKTIRKMLENNEKAFFFVFANNNNRAAGIIQEILPSNKYLLVPNIAEVCQDYQALILMSSCRHFIMSNSTFSWWGAWLSWAKSKDSPSDAIYYIPSHWDKGDQAEQLSRSFKFSSQCLLLTDLAN